MRGRQAYGRNKYNDKQEDARRAAQNPEYGKADSLVKQYFYSRSTYRQTVAEGARFLEWARQQSGRRLSVEAARPYVEAYLDHKKAEYQAGRLSAGTLQAKRSQLSKVYRIDLNSYQLPKRTAPEKGRIVGAEKWAAYKANNPDKARFYAALGCRQFEYRLMNRGEFMTYRMKCEEATGVRIGLDASGRACNIQPAARDSEGRISAVVVAHGKHGRSRISEILPEDRQYISDIWDSGRIYDYLGPNDRVPTQAARREYAQALYRAHCRDLTQLSDEQIYSCRDGSGRHFDREAVALVSRSLGHGSDRYTYVINNYLR